MDERAATHGVVRLAPPADADPFERPVDRVLEGLRRQCRPDPYRLVPGEGEAPDRWTARCPLHPDSGFCLIVTDCGERDPGLWCRVGCQAGVIRDVLLGNPGRDRLAAARAKVLVWGQNYRRAA
jgi:hypothetical protein